MNQPEKQPFGLHLVAAMAQRNAKVDEAISKLSREVSDAQEEKVLMPLWQALGDHSETYYQAMLGISSFLKLRDEFAACYSKLPVEIFVPVAKAAAETLLAMASSAAQGKAIREAIVRENPLPTDKA